MDTPQPTPEEMQARVLHRDGLMLVIDKPAGIAVHKGPKGGPNLEASFDALRYGLPRPPVLAHRLDRDTSGCLVLGRHRKATASLGLLFKHGKIDKTYWAVVEGAVAGENGEIDIPLGRLNEERGWWQRPDPDGLPSLTKWRVLGRGNGLTSSLRRRSVQSRQNAPPAFAQKRSRVKGWLMSPSVGVPADRSPMSVPHSGAPMMKARVPSMGSMTQR